ncbi:MAG TPA: FtsQ-type POTRA domain-containing protein [Terriglobales bacterium]|nr:FtsQ-type POTRA domain-containing protein [Terriglobales bacterium]
MATYLEHGPLLTKTAPPDPALVFQRGRGAAGVKAGRKRRVLRAGHVVALTALAAALFFGVARAWLFLVSWDELTVRRIELAGGRDSVRAALTDFLANRPVGNILLCDLALLQRQLETCPWVRDARIRKVLPATLRIEIEERRPFALLEKDGLALVDAEATVLERTAAGVWPGTPVIRDEGGFRENFWEKWRTARSCLEALTAAERERLNVLECSDDGRLTLEFRDDPVRLIVDGGAVRARLDRFAACRGFLESRFGPLAYADLRLDDRIIVEPQPPEAGAAPAAPKTPKESD